MAPRLASHIEVSALIRRVEGEGGTAAVIRKGDREAGAILILLAKRGISQAILERSPAPDGAYRWRCRPVAEIERKQSLNDYLHQRRSIDSDLWVLELDIPRSERFAAEMTDVG